MSDDIEFEQDDEWFDDDGWVSIPNRMARDGGEGGLSWEARGMLVYLRSHSKKWKTRMADLEREGNCGRERTRRILGELIDAGYVKRERKQTTPGGPLQWHYMTFRRRSSARSTGDPTVGKPVDRETRPSEEPTVGEPVDIEKTNSSEHQEQEHQPPEAPRAAESEPDDEPAIAIERGARRRRGAASLARSARSADAQRVVNAWAAGLNRRPPRQVFTDLCVQVDGLLAEQYPDDVITAALVAWNGAGRSPLALASFAHQAANRTSAPRTTPHRTADSASEATARHFDALFPAPSPRTDRTALEA